MTDRMQNELRERYFSRSLLFWKLVKDAKFAKLHNLARSASWKNLQWNWEDLGISEEGKKAADNFGFVPTEVFAHPSVIKEHPELVDYYRLLACLPRKGLSQIKRAKGAPGPIPLCILLNGFISGLLSKSSRLTGDLILRTIFSEAGSEWQGTWVNKIGILAAQEMERLIVNYARDKNFIDDKATQQISHGENAIILKSGAEDRFWL